MFSSKRGGDHTELLQGDVHCVFTCNMLYTEEVYKTVYNLQIKVRMKNKL